MKYTLSADLWSVGIVAYQLLTGRLPFAGEDGEDVSEVYMSKQVSARRGAGPAQRDEVVVATVRGDWWCQTCVVVVQGVVK